MSEASKKQYYKYMINKTEKKITALKTKVLYYQELLNKVGVKNVCNRTTSEV